MFRAYKFIKELIGDYFKFTNSQKSKEFCIKKGIEDVYRLKEQTIAFSEILIENPSQIIERNSMGFPPEKIYLPILELNGINTNKSLTTLCELDYDEKLYGIKNSISQGVELWNQKKQTAEGTLKDIHDNQDKIIAPQKLLTLDDSFQSLVENTRKLIILLDQALGYLTSKYRVKLSVSL